MVPEQKSIQLKQAHGFPWVLLSRWLIGFYLILASIFGAFAYIFPLGASREHARLGSALQHLSCIATRERSPPAVD
jgi:hypothetical protein